MLIHTRPGNHRQSVRDFCAREGISPRRLSFVEHVPLTDYFALYQKIDVALDPFPYNGGTTTCDALWMGVPVVTLAGRMAVSRGGLSLLSNVGFPELVAESEDQYVEIAAELSHDLRRLRKLRSTLRSRMLTSPLMNAPRFAQHVEAAYRMMWERWCGQPADQ